MVSPVELMIFVFRTDQQNPFALVKVFKSRVALHFISITSSLRYMLP